MCPPTHFAIQYAINPWMDLGNPVDPALALRQWTNLRDAYERLGHDVGLLPPAAGLPDLVFTANAGFVLGDTVLLARFRHPERDGETPVIRRWFEEQGYTDIRQAAAAFEGEGDVFLARDCLVAAFGPRTSRDAHDELAATFDLPVVSLEIADPRYYHLDTAMAVLTDDLIAWYPPALTEASQRVVADLFPRNIVVSQADAEVLGVNVVSDGRHVFVDRRTTHLPDQLREHGLEPVLLDLSEFNKSGGGIKCCTLDLHRTPMAG